MALCHSDMEEGDGNMLIKRYVVLNDIGIWCLNECALVSSIEHYENSSKPMYSKIIIK